MTYMFLSNGRYILIEIHAWTAIFPANIRTVAIIRILSLVPCNGVHIMEVAMYVKDMFVLMFFIWNISGRVYFIM